MAQVPGIAEEQADSHVSPSSSVILRIARYNPETDEKSRFMEFNIPYERWTTVLEAILQTPEEHERYIQFANCIKCGLCNSACPTMATDSSFVGPQALAQAYRYVADSRDGGRDERLRIIDESHGIWRCHFAGSCSQVCPKGVDPAMGIQLLRGYMLGFGG